MVMDYNISLPEDHYSKRISLIIFLKKDYKNGRKTDNFFYFRPTSAF